MITSKFTNTFSAGPMFQCNSLGDVTRP